MPAFPPPFLERLREQFPHNHEEIIASLHQKPPVIRVNTLLTNSEKLQSLLRDEGIQARKIPSLTGALLITDRDRKALTALPAYQDGLFYIQSMASQLVVKALDPKPNEKILDLCAAPGSKTTQIAILMEKKGELIANDNNRPRFFRLLKALEQQRVDDFVTPKNYAGQNYYRFYPEYFDRVLVDAPCSSEARFNLRYPKTMHFWSRHKIRASAKVQRRLLSAAIQCIKPGGVIVYSTCTYAPEENEAVIDAILKKHPEVMVERLPWRIKKLSILSFWQGKTFDPQAQKALRLFPDDLKEGFFICRLRKKARE